MVDFIHFLDHIYLLSIAAHLLTHFVCSLVCLALPSLCCGCFAAHLLTHFVCSLVRLVLLSLRCGHFAAHLLTHFVCSLVCLALPSVTQLPSVALCTHFARAESSLRLLYNKRSLHSHLLYSLVPSISIALHTTLGLVVARQIPFLMFTHFVKFACAITMSILPEEGTLFGSLRLCNHLYYHFR